MSARVQCRQDVAAVIAVDGVHAARIHGRKAPGEGEGAGGRIQTNVAIPRECVDVTGELPEGALMVIGVHGRAQDWGYLYHRLAVGDPKTGELITASPWAPGPWGGDSVLHEAFDPTMPSEAAPA